MMKTSRNGVYTLKDIESILSRILPETPVSTAVLFGSYAKGKQDALSDIDLMIDSKGILNGLNFFGVLETIAEAFSVPVDVIEKLEIIEGSPVHREINNTGVVVYERKS
jgi:predicted nucleotidyltransferase